jgi:outer membrane murein-binding lipoprotein Lpp
MSLYGEALAAIRSIMLLDERLQSLTAKVDKLADEVRDLATRMVRMETIVEIARADGAVLRLLPAEEQGGPEP